MKRTYWGMDLRSISIIFTAFILLILWHRHLTFLDEVDNFIGALAVADGKDIYSGFLSQHTPFVYYYFSIFALLGVSEYETFRLCMAFTILAMWIIIFVRYKKYFSPIVLYTVFLLYPLTANFHWGHMALSDVFQGFGSFVLLLELIVYWRTKQLDRRNAIFISAGIFISVMSAFISVYSVFIIFIGFAIHEWIHNKRMQDYIVRIKSYWMIVWITAAPFAVIILWYAFTGNLKNFYFQAYEFNREYYSRYLDGFGSSSLTVFKDTMVSWIGHIIKSLGIIKTETLVSSLLVIFVLIFVLTMLKESKALGFIIFVFFAFCGTRGYTNWHATPYYIAAFFAVGYSINQVLSIKEGIDKYKKIVIQILAFILLIFSLYNYLPYAGEHFSSPKGTMSADPLDTYIEKLTDPDDTIWISNLAPHLYISTHRKPASRVYSLVPWFADAFSKEIIEDLKTNRPKLISFVPESDVWGYQYKDFASSIFTYIQQNYKSLSTDNPMEKNIYIRNDYYDEAISKLWASADSYGLKDGMLVTDEVFVYLIENNVKRHISNPETFEKNGFKWEDVKKIDGKILNNIKTGKIIDGKL